MNILILVAGHTNFNTNDNQYPLCLTELNGTPLIEHITNSCYSLYKPHFIFAILEQDIKRCFLDNIVRLLISDAKIIKISNQTYGAACTALLAARFIDNDEELLILNGNELLKENFSKVIGQFHAHHFDAGTIVFPSIHPRYSYVRLNSHELVIEAAEKNPISRYATAGFYWFKRGKDFVSGAKNMIRKNETVNNLFYICPTLNELVLSQAKIGVFKINPDQYLPFKTERHFMKYNIITEHSY